MRENIELMEQIIKAKDERASKCLNEFKRKDSCRKGKACRFSHAITDDHRNDASLRRAMDERCQQITGRPLFNSYYQPQIGTHQLSDNYWYNPTNVAEGNRCNINGNVPAMSTPDSSHLFLTQPGLPTTNDPRVMAHQNLQQQHQHPTQNNFPMPNTSPQPLMAVKTSPPETANEVQGNNAATTSDNVQAIKILQNILSHLMTNSQLINGPRYIPVDHP